MSSIEHIQLMESLCVLVRESKHAASAPVPFDVEAAVAAIGRRNKRLIELEKEHSWRLNLKNAKLKGAVLSGADLSGVVLEGADFSKAYLDHVNLSGAALHGVKFVETNLTGADLSHAEGLTQAQLDKATAKAGHLPNLAGVLDAKTGKPLVWRNGKNGKAKP